MLPLIINYSALIAFSFFTIDIVVQIFHIHKIKSSRDISIKGSVIRAVAAYILLVKYYSVNDIFLEIGQTVFTLSLTAYLLMMIYYRKGADQPE
ncbi:MAG: hypothetical protein WC831_03870 [Parcubacteria group bacterium]|jgi:hypothetical protein